MHKLNLYGIRGIVNDWFRDYLSNRVQYVQFENKNSSLLSILCGVPQGSILGPLLYLIYVNDINQSCNGNILSFADDTTMFLSHSDIKTLHEEANQQINHLYEWFCANKLSLNAKKTKYIFIKAPGKLPNLQNYNMLM